MNDKKKREDFMKLVGRNTIRLREEKGMSQSDLAKACGKDRQTLSRIELGDFNVSAYLLSEIAEGLELPLWRLLKFED